MKRTFKSESGAIVLESTLTILFAIIVLAFFIAYGFFLYQKTTVNFAANQIAEEIAQTYKYRNVENGEVISQDDLTSLNRYRYLLNSSDFQSKNEGKAKDLLGPRMSSTSLAVDGGDDVQITLTPKMADLGRMFYQIEVSKRYRFLFHDLLQKLAEMGGATEDIGTVKTIITVDGMDAAYYLNNVTIGKWAHDALAGNIIDDAIGAINKVIELFPKSE